MIATVVIPISPEHEAIGIYKEAYESVRQQTIEVACVIVFDREAHGAAWARNQGTQQVATPFVIWLDADDRLMPEFVEKTLQVYEQGCFVYTDWLLHGKEVITPYPLSPLKIGQQHIITTLMPKVAWESVGGFDEKLDTLEDEDLYRKLAVNGWHGLKCEGALVEYRRDKGFSKVNQEAVDPDIVKARVQEKQTLFEKRYGRYEAMVYMFSHPKTRPQREITGERKPNDVLCEAHYSPMTQAGAITRRKYLRCGLGNLIWVDHDDALARPDLWRIVANSPEEISPDVQRVKELYEKALAEKEAEKKRNAPILDDAPIATASNTPNWYADTDLAELRVLLHGHGIDESELTGGVSIHWKLLRKLIITKLEELAHEAPA